MCAHPSLQLGDTASRRRRQTLGGGPCANPSIAGRTEGMLFPNRTHNCRQVSTVRGRTLSDELTHSSLSITMSGLD